MRQAVIRHSLFITLLIYALGQSGLHAQSTQSNTTAPEGYNLAWEDEFEGSELNKKVWQYRTGKSGHSYQRPENISVEDGNLRINLKKENYQGMKYTGGGIITQRAVRYGYFEVRVKLDCGYGWHEAFWTTWTDDLNQKKPQHQYPERLEIDCFEHYTTHENHQFSYGAIQWAPVHGNVNRDFETTKEDLKEYNVFGFEYTPDYLNYFFNGKLLKTVDIRRILHHDQFVWLSCIANQAEATSSGAVFFDYFRCYEITPEDYDIRKVEFIKYLDSLTGTIASSGTDLWIEAEDFLTKNNWITELEENNIVLKGFTSTDSSRDSTDLKASTKIEVKTAGKYRLWVRARDFSAVPAIRKFKVLINGKAAPSEFGTHRKEGYFWQDGGTFDLPAGATSIDLYDSSQYYARCDKMLLTTDLNFVPSGIGAASNVKHLNGPGTSLDPLSNSNIIVVGGKKELLIEGAENKGITVYNGLGQLMHSTMHASNYEAIKVPAGIAIVSIANKTFKVFIQ